MNIFIYRNGTKDGPYTLQEIKKYLTNGTFNETNLAWYEGCSDWLPLKDVITSASTALPPALPAPPDNSSFAPMPPIESSVGKRYSSAYLVANSITAVGKAFKVIAGVLAFIVFVGVITQGGGFIWGILWGLVAAVPLIILGTLVEANGQILKASLDIAVHTSPFLSKEQMASIMKIR